RQDLPDPGDVELLAGVGGAGQREVPLVGRLPAGAQQREGLDRLVARARQEGSLDVSDRPVDRPVGGERDDRPTVAPLDESGAHDFDQDLCGLHGRDPATLAPVSLPQHCPSARELDDLELFAVGALAPARFEGADGLITLVVPDGVAEAAREAGALELVEPEGTPIARVQVEQTYAAAAGTGISGGVEVLGRNEVGPFRRLHLTPAEVRDRHPDAVTVPVTAPLTTTEIAAIREGAAGRPVVLLALAGTGTPVGVSPVGLVRATLAAAEDLAPEIAATVVAVPLAAHGDASADHALGTAVVAAYAPGSVLALPSPDEGAEWSPAEIGRAHV